MAHVRSTADTVTDRQMHLLCLLVEAERRCPSETDRRSFWYYVNAFAIDRGPHIQHAGLPGGVIAVRAEDFWIFVERGWLDIDAEPLRLRWQLLEKEKRTVLELKEDPMRAWWFAITDAGLDYGARNAVYRQG